MKKILLALSSLTLLVGCKTGGDARPSLTHIELSGDYQTEFVVDETFNYDGLIVTAHYSNNNSVVVTDYQVSSPAMSIIGTQDVKVTYKNKNKTYSINISSAPEVINYPITEAIEFLATRDIYVSSNTFPTSISSLTGVLSSEVVEDEDAPYFHVVISGVSSYQTVIDELLSLDYYLSDGIYICDNDFLAYGILQNNGNLIVNLYAKADLIVIPPEEEDGTYVSDDFPLQDAEYIGKPPSDKLEENGPYSFRDFSFHFHKNGGGTAPKSNKSNNIQLYIQNTFVITASESNYKIKKIELTTADRNDELSVDVGSITQTDSKVTWSGNSNQVTFTVVGYQYKFSNVNIYYFKPTEFVPPAGIRTISELKELADDLTYVSIGNNYLINESFDVQVNLKAIDAIDSVTTSDLPGNARGKVLCVDNTGYIIVSSGVSKNDPIDFYQRVKDYIEKGTTTYYVTGHLAKFNGVLEIYIDTYQYVSTLSFDYDLNDYLSADTVNSSDSFMNHCKAIQTNKNGYGVGDIVRLNGLTYFNKYRKAGSYYFLDRESKIVPIYSLLDKDSASLILGNTYDIIGLESIYEGRPSLRILEVIRSEEEPVEFDLNSAVEKTDTAYFYNVNPDKAAYAEEFYNSVRTVYKMEVYVSRYTDDKYTFNVSYHWDGVAKEYTTGSSQQDAANHNSLGMSNENLDHNETFYSYALELAKTQEEVEELKVTIYFTLTLLKTVNSKSMWEVNVFEDFVPQLGD